jgi:1-acyl-sn-glycerol-3-phosphate acyltransferase
VYRGLLGLGFILGAAIVISLGDALRSQIAMTWGLFGIGTGMGFLALSVVLPLSQTALMRIGGVGIVLAGASALGVMASFQTLLQRIVADKFRGRVFGVNDLVCTFSLLIATGMLGIPRWERLDRWAGVIVGSVAVVTILAGVTVLYVRLHRGPHGWALNLGENLNEFIVKFWYRFQRIGRPTVPHTGPVIVTSNHVSAADPLLLCAGAPYRAISFMIAAEYASWPIVSFFVRALECIPVHRGTRETSATKQALRHLEQGRAVGIFIEGGISGPGETPQPKDGVAMMALRTGAVVVPAYISGMTLHQSLLRGLFSRQNAKVRWGRPVNLDEFRSNDPSRETIRAATAKIYTAVLALAPETEVDSGGRGSCRAADHREVRSPTEVGQ